MTSPAELKAPGIWVPRRGRVRVLLPYNPNHSANVEWLRENIGSPDRAVNVTRGPGSTWELPRAHADNIVAELVQRFGRRTVTIIHDVSTQRKCGSSCQGGKPERALQCECQCGGSNHGGFRGLGWLQHDDFLIETTTLRTVFTA